MNFLLLAAGVWVACGPGQGLCTAVVPPPPGAVRIEFSDGRQLCATRLSREILRPDGTRVWTVPLDWYVPHPGDPCWRRFAPTDVQSRQCYSDGKCSEWSAFTRIDPMDDWMCWQGEQRVPCEEAR